MISPRAHVRAAALSTAVALFGVAACAVPAGRVPAGTPQVARPGTPPPTSPTPTTAPATTPPTELSTEPSPAGDPRWRFFTDDTTHYFSPWYTGAHRIMIGFGCTDAPYYRADARCSGGRGFHHGIDVAIPCGVVLRSAVEGRVVLDELGAAYGSNAFRIRTADLDVLIGHARTLLVGDGDRVAAGQPIAEVGALGAPDGCHLHLEQRAVGGGLSTATDPSGILALRR